MHVCREGLFCTSWSMKYSWNAQCWTNLGNKNVTVLYLLLKEIPCGQFNCSIELLYLVETLESPLMSLISCPHRISVNSIPMQIATESDVTSYLLDTVAEVIRGVAVSVFAITRRVCSPTPVILARGNRKGLSPAKREREREREEEEERKRERFGHTQPCNKQSAFCSITKLTCKSGLVVNLALEACWNESLCFTLCYDFIALLLKLAWKSQIAWSKGS